MSTLRVTFVGGYLAYQGLFQWLTKRLIVPTLVIRPAMQLAAFTLIGLYIGQQPASYYAIGNAVQTTARAAVFAATIVIAAERTNGTLSFVLAAPSHPLVAFGGRLVPPILTGLLSSTLMLGLAMALTGFRITWSSLPTLVLLILVISLSCSALGLVLGSIGLYLRDVFFLPNIAVYAMMLLCGVNLTTAETPPVLRAIGEAIPLTHGLRATRAVIAGRTPATADWVAEVIIAVVYTVLACFLLQLFARLARAGATLDLGS
jgi:ABC-2 type transport system permease protein